MSIESAQVPGGNSAEGLRLRLDVGMTVHDSTETEKADEAPRGYNGAGYRAALPESIWIDLYSTSTSTVAFLPTPTLSITLLAYHHLGTSPLRTK